MRQKNETLAVESKCQAKQGAHNITPQDAKEVVNIIFDAKHQWHIHESTEIWDMTWNLFKVAALTKKALNPRPNKQANAFQNVSCYYNLFPEIVSLYSHTYILHKMTISLWPTITKRSFDLQFNWTVILNKDQEE